MSAERLWAVVPAAGEGGRLGAARPKQYLPVLGRTVLEWSLQALLDGVPLAGVVVVLAPQDTLWPRLPLAGDPRIRACEGGVSRHASVARGLAALDRQGAAPEDAVLVHDGARPCVRPADIRRLADAAAGSPDGGLLAAPVRDTLKRAAGAGTVAATVSREGLWQAFTPQLFPLGALRAALAACGDTPVTDEAEAMERHGARPRLVEGAADNIKLTYASDLPLVEAILAARRQREREA